MAAFKIHLKRMNYYRSNGGDSAIKAETYIQLEKEMERKKEGEIREMRDGGERLRETERQRDRETDMDVIQMVS